MSELKYWLWLTTMQGMTNAKIGQLLKKFFRPSNIFNSSKLDFEDVSLLKPADVLSLCNKSLEKAEDLLKECFYKEINIITVDDYNYPQRLSNIFANPYILYYKGNFPDFDNVLSLAMVGSRRASLYGAECAQNLAYELSKKGIIIVSGMAKGIDTYAHKGALNAGGITCAVLGCGVDVVYPKENKELYYYIQKNGAIISEYPPGTSPMPYNFPARNRIISGISVGTVVVEAGITSGSLITADFALEQGRDVFAVPGAINAPGSLGTNLLIKDGAKIVTNVEDIWEEYKLLYNDSSNENNTQNKDNNIDIKGLLEQSEAYNSLSSDEKLIVASLSNEPIHIDELSRITGIRMSKLTSAITMLEMRGIIEQRAMKSIVLCNI